MLLSLLQLCYLLRVKPFKEKINNYLEIMNEFFYLYCIYHLYVFTDFYDDYKVKYKLGFSLIILVILQIAINLFVILIDTVLNLVNFVKLWIKRLRMRKGKKTSANFSATNL